MLQQGRSCKAFLRNLHYSISLNPFLWCTQKKAIRIYISPTLSEIAKHVLSNYMFFQKKEIRNLQIKRYLKLYSRLVLSNRRWNFREIEKSRIMVKTFTNNRQTLFESRNKYETWSSLVRDIVLLFLYKSKTVTTWYTSFVISAQWKLFYVLHFFSLHFS